MFSIVVFMSALQQIAIGVIVAGAVGYGSAQFSAGSLQKQVDINTEQLRTQSDLAPRVANLEKRFDTFEALVIDGQKESRDIAYKILGEIAEMRKDTAVNSSEIGAIKVDIAEIKEKVK
jgi:hypothetical protein